MVVMVDALLICVARVSDSVVFANLERYLGEKAIFFVLLLLRSVWACVW